MTDTETLESRLSAAEDALHRLMTGDMEVEVEFEGTRSKFARADESRLRQYIRSLERKLGRGVSSRSRRALV
jgi:ketosteroid isomerase-like protein